LGGGFKKKRSNRGVKKKEKKKQSLWGKKENRKPSLTTATFVALGKENRGVMGGGGYARKDRCKTSFWKKK